jgi:hypothetical protein
LTPSLLLPQSVDGRQTPVNPLTFEDGRYLVAPRGNTPHPVFRVSG